MSVSYLSCPCLAFISKFIADIGPIQRPLVKTKWIYLIRKDIQPDFQLSSSLGTLGCRGDGPWKVLLGVWWGLCRLFETPCS